MGHTPTETTQVPIPAVAKPHALCPMHYHRTKMRESLPILFTVPTLSRLPPQQRESRAAHQRTA
jgi:hypothetical protein